MGRGQAGRGTRRARARGRNTPHMTRDEAAKRGGIPKISIDYFFASTVDEKASDNPILVMLDEQTGESTPAQSARRA